MARFAIGRDCRQPYQPSRISAACRGAGRPWFSADRSGWRSLAKKANLQEPGTPSSIGMRGRWTSLGTDPADGFQRPWKLPQMIADWIVSDAKIRGQAAGE